MPTNAGRGHPSGLPVSFGRRTLDFATVSTGVAQRKPRTHETGRFSRCPRPPLHASLPWWKEPTKDQWYAYIAAWLGWTLDAFDFTVFLLIMAPIAQEFGVPLIEVTIVSPSRCSCAWSARRPPAGWPIGWGAEAADDLHPVVLDLQLPRRLLAHLHVPVLFRALLGIGMGAEWPAGAALAMESWPARSRGFMSGVLQGSWGLGFALSALAYGFLYRR